MGRMTVLYKSPLFLLPFAFLVFDQSRWSLTAIVNPDQENNWVPMMRSIRGLEVRSSYATCYRSCDWSNSCKTTIFQQTVQAEGLGVIVQNRSHFIEIPPWPCSVLPTLGLRRSKPRLPTVLPRSGLLLPFALSHFYMTSSAHLSSQQGAGDTDK